MYDVKHSPFCLKDPSERHEGSSGVGRLSSMYCKLRVWIPLLMTSREKSLFSQIKFYNKISAIKD